MVVHSEKEAHVVRLTQQLELLVAHPERVGQIEHRQQEMIQKLSPKCIVGLFAICLLY